MPDTEKLVNGKSNLEGSKIRRGKGLRVREGEYVGLGGKKGAACMRWQRGDKGSIRTNSRQLRKKLLLGCKKDCRLGVQEDLICMGGKRGGLACGGGGGGGEGWVWRGGSEPKNRGGRRVVCIREKADAPTFALQLSILLKRRFWRSKKP